MELTDYDSNSTRHLSEIYTSTIISKDELEMLYDKVLIQLPSFKKLGDSDKIWDDCLPLLEELVKHPDPVLYISTIKNRIRKIKESIEIDNSYRIRVSNIVAMKLYVILYYRFRDEHNYINLILPDLEDVLGFFKDQRWRVFDTALGLMKKLPPYKGHITVVGNSVVSNTTELENTLINLRLQNSKLSEENANLYRELQDIKERQKDPDEEQTFIDCGQGRKLKHHKTSARQVAQIVKDSGKLNVMSKKEWEKILSDITGLDTTTFHSHLVKI